MNLAMRAAAPADEDFLFALFLSSRDTDLSFIPEPQRSALMRMQFQGQQQTYVHRYPISEHNIVCVDGVDAGRLWIAQTPEEIHVVDISLLPAWRNRGIGTKIYSDLVERSAAAGVPFKATVSTANPGSIRFHERLGFQRAGGDGMYISMIRL